MSFLSNLANFISYLFYSVIFVGWGAKILSVGCLVFGLWLLVRRENVTGFLTLTFFSFLFAYLGGILVHIF